MKLADYFYHSRHNIIFQSWSIILLSTGSFLIIHMHVRFRCWPGEHITNRSLKRRHPLILSSLSSSTWRGLIWSSFSSTTNEIDRKFLVFDGMQVESRYPTLVENMIILRLALVVPAQELADTTAIGSSGFVRWFEPTSVAQDCSRLPIDFMLLAVTNRSEIPAQVVATLERRPVISDDHEWLSSFT